MHPRIRTSLIRAVGAGVVTFGFARFVFGQQFGPSLLYAIGVGGFAWAMAWNAYKGQ
ncbi:MAG: hypothetical protein RL291_791 [Pseudomonadota bacterium]|jgi:hypothetical protein